MDGTRVKNIIIGLLVLVNLFLLAMFLRDKAESAEVRREAQKQVSAVLADSGISLLSDVPWDAEPMSCSLCRDLSAEQKMTASVLGRCHVQDLGGNILFYKSEKGEARFRGTGEFQIMPYMGEVAGGSDQVNTAVAILRKMGIESDPETATVERGGETTTITLTCMFRGENVYNCKVGFLFSSEYLLMIDGRRPMEYSAEQPAEALDAATMLLHYVSELRTGGLICSEIRSVELGWLMSASASGDGTMTPFWKIETDVGQNYLNGLTGKIDSIV